MNKLFTAFAGLGAAAMLIWAVVAFTCVGLSIYGLVLAFTASIVLGIFALFVPPVPLVIGLVYLLSGTNLAIKIVEFLSR